MFWSSIAQRPAIQLLVFQVATGVRSQPPERDPIRFNEPEEPFQERASGLSVARQPIQHVEGHVPNGVRQQLVIGDIVHAERAQRSVR